jgi:hypothetical protein
MNHTHKNYAQKAQSNLNLDATRQPRVAVFLGIDAERRKTTQDQRRGPAARVTRF